LLIKIKHENVKPVILIDYGFFCGILLSEDSIIGGCGYHIADHDDTAGK